jgi:hypothetical protein|nr:MAG TPA: hypothetical protein [Caudoviricetes sp.]
MIEELPKNCYKGITIPDGMSDQDVLKIFRDGFYSEFVKNRYRGEAMRSLENETTNEYKVKGGREITNGERKVGEVIGQAMLRCFSGKGKERHNIEGTVDFMDQPLMEISRRVGIGGPLYQVHKKAYEAHDMVRKGDFERARNELLDIIIYTAATVLLLDEQKGDK